MKKFSILICLLALVSCQEVNLEDEFTPVSQEDTSVTGEQEAIRIASCAASLLDDASRSARSITAKNAVTPVYSTASRVGVLL